jgi:hypothetical protein
MSVSLSVTFSEPTILFNLSIKRDLFAAKFILSDKKVYPLFI